MLLDALEKDADELKALRPTICLEIGQVPRTKRTEKYVYNVCSSGSGCVSAFMGHILGPSVSTFVK